MNGVFSRKDIVRAWILFNVEPSSINKVILKMRTNEYLQEVTKLFGEYDGIIHTKEMDENTFGLFLKDFCDEYKEHNIRVKINTELKVD